MRTPAGKPTRLKTLIIGLGNPILGDDSVGWRVVEGFAAELPLPGDHPGLAVELEYLSLGGLSLMERMVGYHRVILVDAIATGQKPPGTVSSFPIEALPDLARSHTASAHDTSLREALRVGQAMGFSLPQHIEVVAIEADTIYEFSEELSAPVATAVPEAVQAVMDLVLKPYRLAEKEPI